MIMAILFSVGTPTALVSAWHFHCKSVAERKAFESHQIKEEMYLDKVMQRR